MRNRLILSLPLGNGFGDSAFHDAQIVHKVSSHQEIKEVAIETRAIRHHIESFGLDQARDPLEVREALINSPKSGMPRAYLNSLERLTERR